MKPPTDSQPVAKIVEEDSPNWSPPKPPQHRIKAFLRTTELSSGQSCSHATLLPVLVPSCQLFSTQGTEAFCGYLVGVSPCLLSVHTIKIVNSRKASTPIYLCLVCSRNSINQSLLDEWMKDSASGSLSCSSDGKARIKSQLLPSKPPSLQSCSAVSALYHFTCLYTFLHAISISQGFLGLQVSGKPLTPRTPGLYRHGSHHLEWEAVQQGRHSWKDLRSCETLGKLLPHSKPPL